MLQDATAFLRQPYKTVMSVWLLNGMTASLQLTSVKDEGKEEAKESPKVEATEKAKSGDPDTSNSGDNESIPKGGDGADDAEVSAQEPEEQEPQPAEHVPNPERLYPKRPGGACPAGWMKVPAGTAAEVLSEGGTVSIPRVVKKALPPLILPPAGDFRNSTLCPIPSASRCNNEGKSRSFQCWNSAWGIWLTQYTL